MKKEKSTREHILDTALTIASSRGLKELTQTNVAAAAGVRQSHLTYYFPLKSDLLAAVLKASHDNHNAKDDKNSKLNDIQPNPDRAIQIIEEIFLNRNRLSFFLGVLAESIDENELRSVLKSHMDEFSKEICVLFGKNESDQSVDSFLDHMRGVCFSKLLVKSKSKSIDVDVRKIAKLHKLI